MIASNKEKEIILDKLATMKRSVDNNIKGQWFFKKETCKTPFGMTLPGRSYNAHTSRHGFTGHEKESDLAEGIYTTEYRLYDARVGRWLSVDPLMDNAGESPYLYCSGMPMTYFDPVGRVKREKNGEVIFIEEKSDDWFLLHIYEDPAFESPDDYEVKYQLYSPKETK